MRCRTLVSNSSILPVISDILRGRRSTYIEGDYKLGWNYFWGSILIYTIVFLSNLNNISTHCVPVRERKDVRRAQRRVRNAKWTTGLQCTLDNFQDFLCKLDIKLHKGAFKYYVIKEVGGWGQTMAIFDDLQYCKSSKRWLGGPKKVKNMMT